VSELKIYALVGPSGTGKSHKAMNVASDRDIKYIIDDGLLINKSKKIAGSSAKREKTIMAAVKRAIFHFDEHRIEVSDAIKKVKPDSILLIGTSVKMVKQIAEKIEVGEIDEFIFIEDVSTNEEIEFAKDERMKHGKHIIPLPSLELKRDFSGYFLDNLKTFFRKNDSKIEVQEKSVVRPTFSYMGNYTISNKTLMQIVTHTCEMNECVEEVYKVRVTNSNGHLSIDVDVRASFDCHLLKMSRTLQENSKKVLEDMTRMMIEKININIKSIQFD
jgi:uncharacterized alkaline shock family protein YloU